MATPVRPRVVPITSTKSTSMQEILDDPRYQNALFVFSDTVFDHFSSDADEGEFPGLRPYNRHGLHAMYPRSAGIPVMWDSMSYDYEYFEGGDQTAYSKIDQALDEIRHLIQKHQYPMLVFFGTKPEEAAPHLEESSDRYFSRHRPLFATAVIDRGVRRYITRRLYALGDYSHVVEE